MRDFEFADECSEEVLTELTESVVSEILTDNLMPPSRSSAPTQERIAVEMHRQLLQTLRP